MITTIVRIAVQTGLARGSSSNTRMSAAGSEGAGCFIRTMSPRSVGPRVRLPHLGDAFPPSDERGAPASALIVPELVPGQSRSLLVHVTRGNAGLPGHPSAILVLGRHRHGPTLEQSDLHGHGAVCGLDLQIGR